MQTYKNNYPLQVLGTIRQDKNHPNALSSLRIMYDDSFVNYYKWHIEQYFHFLINTPMHGAHSTIIRSDFIKPSQFDAWKILMNKWHGTKVLVNYNPHIFIGGYTRTFRNFYLKIRSNVLDELAEDFGINSKGFHVTVGNSKNDNGNGFRPNFGKMIEIR